MKDITFTFGKTVTHDLRYQGKQKNAESALSAFLKSLSAVESELDELKAKASDHFGTDPDTLNWGHVGDLNRVLELLRQANGKVK